MSAVVRPSHAAVVPLEQVLVVRLRRQPRQLRGVPRAGQRAAEHQSRVEAGEQRPGLGGAAPPGRGERDVGPPGVPAGEAPLGLPVPEQRDHLRHGASWSGWSDRRRTGSGVSPRRWGRPQYPASHGHRGCPDRGCARPSRRSQGGGARRARRAHVRAGLPDGTARPRGARGAGQPALPVLQRAEPPPLPRAGAHDAGGGRQHRRPPAPAAGRWRVHHRRGDRVDRHVDAGAPAARPGPRGGAPHHRRAAVRAPGVREGRQVLRHGLRADPARRRLPGRPRRRGQPSSTGGPRS